MSESTTTEPRVDYVCSNCGSEGVTRDANAVWSTETQEWELEAVFDQAFCRDCDGETSIKTVEL